MDYNKNIREMGTAIALDLIVGYDVPRYNKLVQENYFRTNKPKGRDEILYVEGVAASLLVQAYLSRHEIALDTPWPRKKLDFSEWQWRAFAEILEIFPSEFSEYFYRLDNSKIPTQREQLTLIQVALQHTFDRLSMQILHSHPIGKEKVER